MKRRAVRLWPVILIMLCAFGVALASGGVAPATGQPAPGSATATATPAATPAPTPLPPVFGANAYGVLRDPSFAALPGATAHWGYLAGGAFRIEIPDTWNGGLVMYAHGYRGEGPDLYVTNSLVRAHLISRGYAWAASSYRANSYRPDYGVDDTLDLRTHFINRFGQPRWTILEGTSMGGHVLFASLEQHPNVYQGGLAECSAIGIGIIDYLVAYTAAAEYISGVKLLDAASLQAFGALVQGEFLTAMGRPGSFTERGRRFDSVVKNLMGGDLPLRQQGLAAYYLSNLIPPSDRTTSTSPSTRAFRTDTTRYRIDSGLGLTEEELNAGVRRFGPLPGSRSMEENPVFAELTGRLRVPVLSLHTTGDAFVPFSLEQDYRRRTITQGTDHLLVQRAIRRPLHCQFTPPELNRALDDLVAWIEQGAKPEGDDVLTPDLSQIGLKWTVPLHAEDPLNR